jgi:hypothetical protein
VSTIGFLTCDEKMLAFIAWFIFKYSFSLQLNHSVITFNLNVDLLVLK